MRRGHRCAIVLAASLATPLAACAASPEAELEIGTDDLGSRPEDDPPPSQRVPGSPPSNPEPEAASCDDEADADQLDDAGVSDGGEIDASPSDAGSDAGAGATSVTIKLVPTRSDWLVAGKPAPFHVQKDAKNCNLFGNNCDANVSLTVTIDAPATLVAQTPSCSRVQSGTGVRQCSEGSSVTKVATLKVNDTVKVRFHAEAIDDPGANPSCNIDKTWRYTGTGFVLVGETFPATSYWQCVGTGSGQDLDVLLGYKLAL